MFVSYRQSDGLNLAVDMAWALRAAGVPVWHDQTDLPPGETDRRLKEALDSGLSGAVLLVTPEVAYSRVLREIELPRLLVLAEREEFTFSVASTIEQSPDKLDYQAPDRLFGKKHGTLRRLDQQPVGTPRQRADIARAQCRRRMQALNVGVRAAGRTVVIDVQTRIPPFAARFDADLVLRLRPPRDGDRRPNRQGLEDLRHFLTDLPQLVALAGAEHIRLRGGAHLSVSYAIGAALPTTLIGRVEVVDTGGAVWLLEGNASVPTDRDRRLRTADVSEEISSGPVLVYLDLLPTPSDAAPGALRLHMGDHLAGWLHLRPTETGSLDPADATALVGDASHAIRDFAGRYGTTEVHLLLRCPWPVAVLLGRALNTLRVHLYEWEDGPDDTGASSDPRYLASVVVRSGAGGTPIEHVVLPVRPPDTGTSPP